MSFIILLDKDKGVPRQAEVAEGVPARLRPRFILMFRYYKDGRSSAKRTPGEIPGTQFQRLSRPQGTWFCRGNNGKKPPVTPPGIDPGTVRLVAQRLNHYTTPGPVYISLYTRIDLQAWDFMLLLLLLLLPNHFANIYFVTNREGC